MAGENIAPALAGLILKAASINVGENVSNPDNTILSASELRLVTPDGKTAIVLSAKAGQPSMSLLRPDGEVALSIALGDTGLPSITLSNKGGAQPETKLEIDEMGAHLLFSHGQGVKDYFFLNKEARGGLAFNDQRGERRASITVDGGGKVATMGLNGETKP